MTPTDYRDREGVDVVVPTYSVVEDDCVVVNGGKAPMVVAPVAIRPTAIASGRGRGGLIKPVAMKVARPIPRRVTEQFYDEAYQEGLTMQETHQATIVAQEWHRKWTQQDEEGHTQPHIDFYAHPARPQELDCVPVIDRQGAKNPSLGENDDQSYHGEDRVKRSRGIGSLAGEEPSVPLSQVYLDGADESASSWSSSYSFEASCPVVAPKKKQHFRRDEMDVSEVGMDEFPRPAAPQPIRPVAVRLARPIPQKPHDFCEKGVPAHISHCIHGQSLSPISFTDGSTNSESFLMTVVNRQHEEKMRTVHVIDDDDCALIESSVTVARPLSSAVNAARDAVLHALAITRGDVDSDVFKKALGPLEQIYSEKNIDTRTVPLSGVSVEGMWLTLSKPTFFSNLGDNDNGDPMYTLGRMAFDMFSPTNLVCSLQGNFNPVEIVDEEERKEMLEKVPKSLREEVENGATVLRTYHIIAAFTIETSLAAFPDAPNKDVHRPIRGIMTTYGYSLPDPEVANRHSIWFTGGRIEPNNDLYDITAWKTLFNKHPPKHSFGEKAKLLAVKLLMGANVPKEINEDGSMEYSFDRPLGGHGMAYVDVVYLDDTLRIVRGHRGTVMVFSRMPQH